MPDDIVLLCVGGPQDGQRKRTGMNTMLHAFDVSDELGAYIKENDGRYPPHGHHLYEQAVVVVSYGKRHIIVRDGAGEYLSHVLVPVDQTLQETMRLLIAGYKDG